MCGCLGLFMILGSAVYLWNGMTGQQSLDRDTAIIAGVLVVAGIGGVAQWVMTQTKRP